MKYLYAEFYTIFVAASQLQGSEVPTFRLTVLALNHQAR